MHTSTVPRWEKSVNGYLHSHTHSTAYLSSGFCSHISSKQTPNEKSNDRKIENLKRYDFYSPSSIESLSILYLSNHHLSVSEESCIEKQKKHCVSRIRSILYCCRSHLHACDKLVEQQNLLLLKSQKSSSSGGTKKGGQQQRESEGSDDLQKAWELLHERRNKFGSSVKNKKSSRQRQQEEEEKIMDAEAPLSTSSSSSSSSDGGDDGVENSKVATSSSSTMIVVDLKDEEEQEQQALASSATNKEKEEEEEKGIPKSRNKKKIWSIGILAVVLIVIAVILGIVLGGGSNNDNDKKDQAAVADEGDSEESIDDGEEESEEETLILKCPTEFESSESFILPFDEGDDNQQKIHIQLSSPNTLCTLVELSSDEKYIIPIARSYLGLPWEVSAGKYAGKLNNDKMIDCSMIVNISDEFDSTYCTINLPSASPSPSSSQEEEHKVYQLTTFDQPNYSNRDIIARFLEQTTFGYNKQDLIKFEEEEANNNGNGLDQFASWIVKQQDPAITPIGSHREVFRRHLNAAFEVNSRVGPVTQPCDTGTRYRWTAFGIKDRNKYVTFKTVNITDSDDSGSGSSIQRKVALSIGGNIRTVVNFPLYVYGGDDVAKINAEWPFDLDNIVEADWPDGDYEVCFVLDVEVTNAILMLNHPQLGRCKPIVFNVGPNEYYSNPPIILPPGIIDDDENGKNNNNNNIDFGNTVFLDVPTTSTEYIDTKYYPYHTPLRQEIILTQDLMDDTCNDIDPKNMDDISIFGLFNGEYWIHDPRFTLEENTLKNPLSDGGGSLVDEFANNFNNDGTTVQCSNVPRTFLNEDTCRLSFEETACPYTVGGFKWNRYDDPDYDDPDLYFNMTEEAIRIIHETTSGTGTQYLYAIDGLDITKDPDVDSPCTTNSISRWIPVNCTGIGLDQELSFRTQRLLQILIAYFQRQNSNPFMVEIFHPNGLNTTCSDDDIEKVGFVIPDLNQSGLCWENVHPDHWNVYDFTEWSQYHPGNSDGRNPITEFADIDGSPMLVFPDWHEMSRWNSNKPNLINRLGDTINYFYDFPGERTEELAMALGVKINFRDNANSGASATPGTVICGSPNEIANDPFEGGRVERGAFDPETKKFQSTFGYKELQREMVWTHLAVNDPGQLRQRMAWALSQILVVSVDSIAQGERFTEKYLSYYDIFVRHAFGNYRDILKEVSYTRNMAEMLTFYGGKSTAQVWKEDGNLEYADENYAREIMQLFTTGLVRLNRDGTEVLDSDGAHERVYTNDDIEEYARVWTGFQEQLQRGNIENGNYGNGNTIDPMFIDTNNRDRLPKMGLDGKYIGDGYPLCSDLPEKHFLSKGAHYRLLGATPKPELHVDPEEWRSDESAVYMTLNPLSQLYMALCSPGSNGGGCSYPVAVTLPDTLTCLSGSEECSVDTVRTVKVNDLYYEYIRPACTHQAFYNDAKTLVHRRDWQHIMCGDPRMEIATPACCEEISPSEDWTWNELYNGERTTFASAIQRCGSGNLCTRDDAPNCDEEIIGTRCYDDDFRWTESRCYLAAMIDSNGKVAIVHVPENVERQHVDSSVSADDPKTYFRVQWEGDYNEIFSNCDSIESCRSIPDDRCVCVVSVTDTQEFDSVPSTTQEVLSTLSIGALGLDSSPDQASNGIRVHMLDSNGDLTANSVFEVIDDHGVRHFLKNTKSMVTIRGMPMTGFRNPPHFISLVDEEPRDAHYESDAALDHYFYHPNTAPFLAIRFAQRFGISNPSPRYVETIASAFQSGFYEFKKVGSSAVNFGSGVYGDLGATIAAVLLDREARSVILDTDPSHGSLKEPLLKVLGMMKSLEFELQENEPWIEFGYHIGGQLGQMAHRLPTVFSFFLPEYRPSGPVAQGSLVAPEAQVLTGPRIIGSLNGVFSTIRYGFNGCFNGFANYERARNMVDCDLIGRDDYDRIGLGRISYRPADGASTSEIVNELATLMTAGRLSAESRRSIEEVAINDSETDFVEAAQLLIATTPEFHATNLVKKNGEDRQIDPPPAPSSRPYKAVVYVLLQGGCDSYNMLVPHTCAETNSNGQSLLEQYYHTRTSIAVTDEERSRVIDATGQPCEQFVVHEDLPIVERLYKDGDLSFFANAGALEVPVNKDNYYSLTRTALFAHNTMQQGARRIDPLDIAPGTGILGRMADVLSSKGFTPHPITVDEDTIATVGGQSIPPLIVSSQGIDRFDAKARTETFDVADYVGSLNGANKLHSSVFGETWSQKITQAVADSKVLADALEDVELTQDYSHNDGYLSYVAKMEMVSSLILTHEDRSADRDVIFVEMPHWDHHSVLKYSLSKNFKQLNSALEAFEAEMKAQGFWDQVTLVAVSEFGRTLTTNSGEGTDHAWGGNYFVMGGSVSGGQIHGQYPSDITTSGPLNLGRGRLIPTTSWESMFSPILQWMGIDSEEDLDYCMPNRIGAGTHLFDMDDVFVV